MALKLFQKRLITAYICPPLKRLVVRLRKLRRAREVFLCKEAACAAISRACANKVGAGGVPV
jgi:hypothetical protein